LRWLLGTIGLSGNERVVVVAAEPGDAAAVGALAGLLLGALAAIVADPWIRRRSRAAAA